MEVGLGEKGICALSYTPPVAGHLNPTFPPFSGPQSRGQVLQGQGWILPHPVSWTGEPSPVAYRCLFNWIEKVECFPSPLKKKKKKG